MSLKKCKCCGGTRFIAHQVTRTDVLVDGDNQFTEHLFGGPEAHIYDAGTPYGPYTCYDCGAEYRELEENEEPYNMSRRPDGTWISVETGKPPVITDLHEGTYISEWSGGLEIKSPCLADMKRHTIVNIDYAELNDRLGSLTGKYLEIDGTRYKVTDETGCGPEGDQDAFYIDGLKGAIYISEWDDCIEIKSPCLVNLQTHAVMNIEVNDSVDVEGLDCLTGRYVEIDGERYTVVDKDVYDLEYDLDVLYEENDCSMQLTNLAEKFVLCWNSEDLSMAIIGGPYSNMNDAESAMRARVSERLKVLQVEDVDISEHSAFIRYNSFYEKHRRCEEYYEIVDYKIEAFHPDK